MTVTGGGGGFSSAHPDLIDLTLLPPPGTPDESPSRSNNLESAEPTSRPNSASFEVPPTPFADRQSLEAELRALEASAQWSKCAAGKKLSL